MRPIVHPVLLLATAGAMLSVSACANVGKHREPPTTVVAIKDIQTVTGTWNGLLKRRPRDRGDDFVTVSIHGDGTYEFASARAIGMFTGVHTLKLEDGRLQEQSDDGYAIFTLYERDGEQVIMVEALDKRNDYRYRAELTRAK